ncbi:MAG: hypothetical protein NVSMB5_26730 [Candidatus Velthaea sp.]
MRPESTLYTIGFTQRTAEQFFAVLMAAGVRTLLDTRLHTGGQLSGFAKVPDLPYFLDRIGGIAYRHIVELAPTAELLRAYRAKQLSWDEYAAAYGDLLVERRPERALAAASLDRACLLCSERNADGCHRRIAAEYLRDALASHVGITVVPL